MRSLRALFIRLSALFGLPGRGERGRDRDFSDEIESHLQLHIEDNLRAGLDPAAARRDALMKLGGIDVTRESYRDRRVLPVLETLARDFRYAARTLWKSPGFTVAAVSTLALGIGANTAIFSIINGILIKPLPFKEPGLLVRVWEKGNGLDHLAAAYPNFKDWKEQNDSFDGMAAFRDTAYSMTGIDNPERISGRQVTSNFLSVLGVVPARGRDFSAEDDRAGANLVALISDGLWTRRFGRQPSAVGSTITLNDDKYAVIGVLPPEFHFYSDVDALTTLNAKKDR
ncbi:MAG TPA: ABC transporter permease, partial [Blastocatellia bacterium]|nr:ABC transporter permease [Blastocatellia bacterium]